MSTSKKLEYVQLSRDFDFPDELEEALENDYVTNSQYYSIRILESVNAAHLLGDWTPAEILELVRTWNNRSANL